MSPPRPPSHPEPMRQIGATLEELAARGRWVETLHRDRGEQEHQPPTSDVLTEDAAQRAASAIAAARGAASTSPAKTFATLQARAALAGFQLEQMADGTFVVARWTMTRSLSTFEDVEAFLKQVGA